MRGKAAWLWPAVMAALLAWTGYIILREQSPADIALALREADGRFLLAGAGLMALFVAWEAKATHWILKALGTPRRYGRCLVYSCAGFFVSNITPSATGGQPAQVWLMRRDGVPAAHGAVDMLLVTMGYHTAAVAFGVGALLSGGGLLSRLGNGVGALLGMGFAVFLLLDVGMAALLVCPGPVHKLGRWAISLWIKIHPAADRAALEEGWESQVERYKQGAGLVRAAPCLLPKVVLASMGQLACSHAVPCLVYLAFGCSGDSLWEVFFLQALCSLAVGYLPLPGGAGAAEQVFLRGFAGLFGPALVAPAMMVSRVVGCYLMVAVTGVVTVLCRTGGADGGGIRGRY